MKFLGGMVLLCLTLVAPATLHAQDLGTSRLDADVRLGALYTNNFYYDAPAAGTDKAAGGALLDPRLAFRGSTGATDLTLGLDGEIGAFDTPGGKDNYVDAKGGAALATSLTDRARFNLGAGFQHGHDPFGLNRTENAAVRDADLDVWNKVTADGLFHLGADEAALNTELGINFVDQKYQTNRDVTAPLDYHSIGAQDTVFYNLTPKTSALVQVIGTSYKFDQPFGTLEDRNGTEYSVRGGARWLATAKTNGDVRVGYYKRSFDNTGFSDKGLDWSVGFYWAPLARTALSLDTARAEQQSYRADTFLNSTRTVKVGWTETWTSRTRTEFRAGQVHTRFLGAGRDDDLYNAGIGLNYVLTESFAVVADVDTYSRNSNDPSAKFSRFTSFLGIRYSR